VLAGITGGLLNKLQKVIDASARFIFNVKKRHDISEYLYKAHILLMRFRIIFKLCATTYGILNNSSPNYMKDMIVLRSANYSQSNNYELRSSYDVLLLEHCTSENCVAKFMCQYWNELPASLRYATDFNTFKKDLKTHLFRIAFTNLVH